MLPQSRLLPFLAAFLLSIACGRQTMQDLMTIETYVEAAPDSALVRLAAMDTSAFSAREDAWHRYLTALGRYKAYVDEYDDAPISRAEAWFRAHGDKTRLMKTLYLKGYTEYNAKDYNDAVVSLTEGLRLAEMQGDDFYAGLCCRELGAVFAATFSEKEALDYSLKALDHFKSAERPVHIRYQILKVGQCYLSAGRRDEAGASFQSAIEEGRRVKDTTLIAQATREYANSLVGYSDPDVPLKMYSYINDTLRFPLGSSSSYAFWARAHALKGDIDKSASLFSIAYSLVKTDRQKYIVDYQRFLSAEDQSDSEGALDAVRDVLIYATGKEYLLLDESASESQTRYIQERERNLVLENKLSRQRFYLMVLASILVLLIFTFIFIHVLRLLNERRLRLQKEKGELVDRINTLSASHSLNLKETARSGMRFFDTLAQTYWQKQEHRIVPQLESILKGLVSDEKVIDGLVKTLNNTRGDIMVRLTQQIPTLKKTDIILFCYLASQLGHNTICLILDKNPGAVNAQVYRLRNKIAGSDAPDKAEFLDVIAN